MLAYVFLAFVRFYQLFISPLIGPRCRFQPTCSAYTLEAIRLHGAFKGGWLGLRRIGKCHPWGGFGYDPVPQSGSTNAHGRHTGTCATENLVNNVDHSRHSR
nr:membrane protein insertion efficiency factor YidD [Kordiimonas pumila]